MAKREFLQLAHKYVPEKHGIGGWFMSEKLDGQRCFWDGGVSRGLKKASVPWANNLKDERYKTAQIATGLWSRYGNVIHAPDYWLDKLPNIPLDGELYIPGHRQDLMSIIKALQPGPGWLDVGYEVFDAVPIETLLEPGKIDNTNFKKQIVEIALPWYMMHAQNVTWVSKPTTGFQSRLARLKNELAGNEIAKLVMQVRLPMQTEAAIQMVEDNVEEVVAKGGEGLILRAPNAMYECCRTHAMVKVKKLDDAEGTVIGYITGRATDKGSKLLGMMGALILEIDEGKRLELSGFTDEERTLVDRRSENGYSDAEDWAMENPETECPEGIEAEQFPIGTTVTFRYRGKSKDGIPQEARYWRKRDVE